MSAPTSEHSVSADGPSMATAWSDLVRRAGLRGTPLAEDATGYRGVLLGRNRYEVRLEVSSNPTIEVDVSGRDTPMRRTGLVEAPLSDAGLSRVVEAIIEAERVTAAQAAAGPAASSGEAA